MTRVAPNRGPLPDPSEIIEPTDTLKREWGESILAYLRRLTSAVSKDLERRVNKQQPVSEFYLQSPAGKIFVVTVSDAGALVVTLVKS